MSCKLIACALVLAGLCGLLSFRPPIAAADTAPFTLVKDINTAAQPADSMFGLSLFVPAGNMVFFAANTRETGQELWRSDGTEAGTRLIKDINPGEDSSIGYYGTSALALGNTLLITVSDGAIGDELWASDGTPAGTQLLKDLWPGADSGAPQRFFVAGNRAYFTAQISETQQALWITDGTPAGTVMLKTFAGFNSMRLMDGTLLFSAAELGSNVELWKSNGTPAGTVLVKDILSGQQGSSPTNLIELRPGLLVFSANDGTHGREMWRTDGTSQGTQLVHDIRPGTSGSDPDNIIAREAFYGLPPTYYNVLFAANDGVNGRELWTTDGFGSTLLVKDTYTGTLGSDPSLLATNYCNYTSYTASCPMTSLIDATHGREPWVADGALGMVLLKDIYPGNGWSIPSPMVRVGSSFYFSATNLTTGNELWKTDGTPQGTQQVADINPGAENGNPRDMLEFNGALYFTVEDGTRGRELWKSNGTPAGTTMVKEIGPGAEDGTFGMFGTALGGMYFIAGDGVSGFELWKSDGTSHGTVRVKNIAPDVGGISIYGDYSAAALGDRLAFGLEFESNGKVDGSLWISDGTATGTTPIKSFPGVGYGSAPYEMTALGDGVLFGAFDNIDVHELWRTDGTAVGTAILKNTVKPYFGEVDDLTRLGNQIIFSTQTATSPNAMSSTYAIWRTDGTAQGTQQIKTDVIFSGYNSAASGNSLFFAGSTSDKQANAELWKTDGTTAGTVLVKEITTGTTGSNLSEITAGAPGSVFFIADVGDSGYSLWRSDGTPGGTVQVQDIRPSDNYYEFGELEYAGNTLFFAANDGLNGWELWKSDGTPGGTVLVADIYPGYGSSSPGNLVALNGNLYFSATGPDGRRTLWRSDGTSGGTRPIRTGASAPLNPYELAVSQGRLLFSAAGEHGREAWRSDGTDAGTAMLQDIGPGAESSNPQSFITTGKHVFLTADTPGNGRELWAMPLSAAPPTSGTQRIFVPSARR